MEAPQQSNLRVTIIAADGLYKRDVFRFPDPFAVATINGEQTKTTGVIKKTLNPYWNESFDMRVTEESILAVQIFDQKKFKKRDQGFLGVVNVRIGSVVDLDAGGDEMLTRDLRKSNDNLVVNGKLILNLSTNLRAPIPNGGSTNNRPSVSSAGANGASTPAGAQSSASLQPERPTSNMNSANASRQNTSSNVPSTNGASGTRRADGSGFSAFEDAQGRLPPGWERREDNLGRTYYVDHNSRQTTW
ncbi:putative E3 ubiquitin-protein ligase, partial [Hortaea werneckii]